MPWPKEPFSRMGTVKLSVAFEERRTGERMEPNEA